MNRILFVLCLFLPSFINAQVQGIEDTYYKVPDITLTDIDGTDHNLYTLLDEGKYVLIDLYTTWCQPCRDNAPIVEAWYEEHGPNGDGTVVMWNVECDDNGTNLQDVLDWIEEFSVTSVNFEENDFFWSLDEFPYNSYPSYFMICPDRYYGKVVGYQDDLIIALDDFIGDCPALGTNEHDARLLVFEEDLNVQCSNPAPVLRIENRGLSNLNSLSVNTYVNGDLDNTFSWTGNLAQYEVAKLTLPVLSGNYPLESNAIQFELTEPNGLMDMDASDNEAEGQFQLIDGAAPSIEAGFGYGAQSYTFQIIDVQNVVVFQHTFDASSSYGSESLDLCLSNNECYVFRMIDAVNGNGAGFIFSQEYLELMFEGEQLLYIDETNYAQKIGEFPFCLGDPSVSVADNDKLINVSVYPNPSSGVLNYELNGLNQGVQLTITDFLGRQIIKEDAQSYGTVELTKGLYFVEFRDNNNSLIATEKVLVE